MQIPPWLTRVWSFHTGTTFIFLVADDAYYFYYFRKDQKWEKNIIDEQIAVCKESFSSFLEKYYARELDGSSSSKTVMYRMIYGNEAGNSYLFCILIYITDI